MAEETLKVGFVSIVRGTFDVGLAQQMTEAVYARLHDAGYTLVEGRRIVMTPEEAAETAGVLAAQPLDLLLGVQATFADSTMILSLAGRVDAPLLLWAVPEPHTGGRLRLNSLCGVNLAAHALTRDGYRYAYVYADPNDDDSLQEALAKVYAYAAAGRARRSLRGARIGRAGERPAGFQTCAYDEEGLRETFGVEIVPLDLQKQVFTEAQSAESLALDRIEQGLRQRVVGLDQVDQAAMRGTLGVYAGLRKLAYRRKLSAFAVRCWPEFFTELGCAACGAMSMLSDEGKPSSCEADVNGALTGLLLQSLSGEPAFGSDIVSVDDDHDALVLWHCGLAPLSMADPDITPSAALHSNRKLPLLMEFPLKPGVVTVARLSEATGSYRLVVARAEVVRGAKPFAGTAGLLRFERRSARAALDTILTEGLEHHISITYGDHLDSLLALAHITGLPVLRL